jgi:UDP-N-acetyl-D-mannosaminuronate dehydrogenase
MNILLIGHGEIGKAVEEAFGINPKAIHDPFQNEHAVKEKYDGMLIAFGYSDTFIKDVISYIKEFSPEFVIIFSTTDVGTCSKIQEISGIAVSHCPVEGKHPDLLRSFVNTPNWIGNMSFGAKELFTSFGYEVKHLEKSEYTELLKLLSTTKYGINIEFARYAKECCDKVGLDYEEVKNWDMMVNELYRNVLNLPQYTRYILDPPEGPKGGHCVTPNAIVLDKQFPNPIIDIVAEK